MDQSILTSTKKILGISASDTSFDLDVITHINGALSTLTQMGVGPDVFTIEDDGSTWSEFTVDDVLLGLVKPYVYLAVRTIFDPPATSSLQAAAQNQLERFEWRISVYRESLEWTAPVTEEVVDA